MSAGTSAACHYAESVPELKQTLQAGPKLSEIAHDTSQLMADVEGDV
jgi:hypothetical protein